MKTDKTSRPVIGFLIHSLTGNYSAYLLSGIIEAAEQMDIDLRIFPAGFPGSTDSTTYQFQVLYEWLNQSNLDALIMATGTIKIHQTLAEFLKSSLRFINLPLISLSIPLPQVPSIMVDNASGVREAVTHLVRAHNCRRIVFVKGGEINEEAQIRYQAYLEGLAENRLEPDPKLILPAEFTYISGREAILKLLDSGTPFDSVIAANDEMAFAVLNTLVEKGIKVPYEIPIIGFDDVPDAEYSHPSLTTIRQPLFRQAAQAMEWAQRMVRGKTVPQEIWLSTRLVIRRSCGCMLPHMELMDSPKVAPCHDHNHHEDRTESQESLSHRLMEHLDEFMTPQQAAVLARDLLGIIDSSTEKNHSETLKALEQLFHDPSYSFPISFWQEILSRLYEHYIISNPCISDSAHFQVLFQKARILIGEEIRISEGQARIQLQLEYLRLNELTMRMVKNMNQQGLLKIVAQGLPVLKIPSIFVVLYDREISFKPGNTWKFPQQATLVMGMTEKGMVRLTSSNSTVRPAEILPARFYPPKRRTTYVLMPLFFQEFQSGYVLFEAGPRNGTLYETLRLQISSLLKIGVLFREQREAQAELKRANTELEKSLEMQYQLNNALIESSRELDDANSRLHQLSITDGLTQLYNRRFFNELYPKQYMEGQRLGNPIALLMIDIDHFKKINDTYGHAAGDICLSSAARIIDRVLKRPGDMAARYGGEEFSVILPNTDLVGARNLAEQIRLEIETSPVEFNKTNIRLTVSIGCAVALPKTRQKPEDLLHQADKALYRAKEEGRNCVRD